MTKNIVPRADGEGSIGTTAKKWLKGLFGSVFLGTSGIVDSNGNEVLKPESVASAINEITIKNAAAGNAPEAKATGDDTDINFVIRVKGTGAFQVMDGSGNILATFDKVVSAVNYITLLNSATASGVVAKAVGTDTDIDFIIKTKGVGKFQVVDGNDNEIAEFHSVASAVNFLKLLASATGVALSIEAVGTDTDIDIIIVPKNAGKFKTGAGVELTGTGKEFLAKVNTISFTEQVLTSGAAIAWDLKNGNRARLTAEYSFTITITKPSGAIQAELVVTQDGTGSRVMDEIVTQSDATIETTDVDAGTDTITVTVDIPTGARIRFKTSAADLPDPLVVDTIYYAIRVDSTHIKVATTKANAMAGTQINITDQGTGTHTVQQLVKWVGGTLGVLQTAAGGEDIVRLAYKPNDEQWYAQILANFY